MTRYLLLAYALALLLGLAHGARTATASSGVDCANTPDPWMCEATR